MSDTTEQLDAWGMAWVHQVYRREFRLLPTLVRGVADGDRERAAIVAEHITDMVNSLHEHHVGEDELLWPKLLERAKPDAEVVHRMEKQHGQLHELLQRLEELAPRWRASAEVGLRDELAELLSQVSAVTDEHLADEEQHVMPLINQHISQAEWLEFEIRGHQSIPQEKALLFLGLGLEDATPHEREMFMGGLPPEVKDMWVSFGEGEYGRLKARLHGTAA